jgi:hypothetical protein
VTEPCNRILCLKNLIYLPKSFPPSFFVASPPSPGTEVELGVTLACRVGALLLEPHLQVHFALVILKMRSWELFAPGLLPTSILPTSASQIAKIYRCESPAPGFFWLFETRSGCVAQAALELVILLFQPPECWDYSCTPSHPGLVAVFMCKLRVC